MLKIMKACPLGRLEILTFDVWVFMMIRVVKLCCQNSPYSIIGRNQGFCRELVALIFVGSVRPSKFFRVHREIFN